MSLKTTLASAFILASVSAHAIPPVPPAAIFNKIKNLAAKKCTTKDGEIAISDLKDTDAVKFELQLNNEGSGGELSVVENGTVVENFEVSCK